MGVLGQQMSIFPAQQALVFVVRKDGEPGLYLGDGVSKGHAIALFQMMIDRLLQELAEESGDRGT